jgi:hypothetical protein
VPLLIVESDWRVTNPPLAPTISPNTSNQNFEIAILLTAVDSSGNYIFDQGTPPTVFRVRVKSHILGLYKAFIESFVVKTRKRAKGSFDLKFKGLVPFLIVVNVWRATNLPLTPTFSPNTSNQHF